MAEHDGKVTFDLEIDDSKVRGALSRALSAIRSQAGAAKISVSAETGAAISSLAKVKAAENDLTGKTITVDANTGSTVSKLQKVDDAEEKLTGKKIDVEADTGTAKSGLEDIGKKADDVGAKKHSVDVSANTKTADDQLDATQNLATGLETADPNVEVTARTASADIKLQRTQGLAYGVEGSDPTVDVTAITDAADTLLTGTRDLATQVENSDPNVNATATTGGANPLLERTRDLATEVENSDPNVNVTANDSASSVLEGVRSLADDLDGKTVNINVNGTGDGSSFGSNLIQGVGQGIGHTLPGAAFGAAQNTIGSVFSSGLTYESGLAKVSTLMPDTADKEAFGAAALALAGDLGIDTGTMMEAAYNALSASVDYGKTPGGENLLNFLELSAKLGIGGFTDTNTAADALTSVYNAYNGEISTDAIANLMLRTQNKGKITVGQIAQSVAQITPAASTSGVGFDQVGAMWAALTAGGVQPAQAATQIRTLLNELNDTKSEGNKAMKAALAGSQWQGMTLPEIMANGGSMVEVLSAIQQYADRKGLALSNFFGSSEAASAVAFLTGENLDRFKESLDYMHEEGDVVNEAYETMAKTTEQSLARIRSQFAAYAAEIFTALSPAVEKFLEVIQGEKFKETFGRFVDKITELLSGDAIEGLVDGLISTANWLLDLFSGKISLGDVLKDALVSVWEWLKGSVLELAEGFVNGIIDGLNGIEIFGQKVFDLKRVNWTGKPVEGEDRGEPTTFPGSAGTPHGGLDSDGDTGARGRFGNKRSGGGGGSSGGGAGRDEAKIGTSRAESEGMSLAEIEIAKVQESSKAAAESTAATAESTAATAESQATIAEASGETAVSLEETAQNEASIAHASRLSSGRATSMARNLASANTSLLTAVTKAAQLPPAITSLVDSLDKARRAAGGSVTDPHVTQYAVGLDYVPHDNFPALLHRGEMVLNAAEASAMRFGGLGASPGIDPGALASAMAGLAVEMDGRVVGKLVERSVSAQQAVRLNRTQYGRGG